MKKYTGYIILTIIAVTITSLLLRGKSSLTSPKSIQQPEAITTNKNLTKYIDFTEESFNNTQDKKRIIFFHASWCPTCKVANKELTERHDEIPDDIIVFKTDYDTETALKKKYNITYQHTFVQVDENGDEITQWNGGGLRDIQTRTK